MKTAIGTEENQDWKGAECPMCGSHAFLWGIWHRDAFRRIAADVEVHDPYCEAYEAKECVRCGFVVFSPEHIGPLSEG